MKKIIKNYFSLIIGIILPFALLLFFIINTYLTEYFVQKSKYKLLFYNSKYYCDYERKHYDYDIKIKDNKLIFIKNNNNINNNKNYHTKLNLSSPKLYIFDPSNNNIKEIKTTIQENNLVILDNQMENFEYYPTLTSPDNYHFSCLDNTPGVLNLLLYKYSCLIKNKNYYLYIPFKGDIQFIAWVKEK